MKGILPRGDRAGGSAARAPLASPAAAIVSAPRATARTLRLRPQRPPCALRLAGPTRPFSQPEMRSACRPGIGASSLLTLECIILQEEPIEGAVLNLCRVYRPSLPFALKRFHRRFS